MSDTLLGSGWRRIVERGPGAHRAREGRERARHRPPAARGTRDGRSGRRRRDGRPDLTARIAAADSGNHLSDTAGHDRPGGLS